MGTGSGVVDTPAGNDTIYGRGGDDTLVGGDRGLVDGGDGDDSIVGGRSTAAGDRTVIHGADGNDTIVSGLGNDEIFGDAGRNTLAYASVQQSGIDIVDRGTNGVTATLPNAGLTATGGRTGGPEQDIIHSDIGTLVGGNGNDVLVGNDLGNQILGVAPAGTAGVKPGPAGNDALVGIGGSDLMLGAEGNDFLFGGAGNDILLGFAGSDHLIGESGTDNFNAGEGNDRQLRPGRRRRGDHLRARGPTAPWSTRSTPSPRATARPSAPRRRPPLSGCWIASCVRWNDKGAPGRPGACRRQPLSGR